VGDLTTGISAETTVQRIGEEIDLATVQLHVEIAIRIAGQTKLGTLPTHTDASRVIGPDTDLLTVATVVGVEVGVGAGETALGLALSAVRLTIPVHAYFRWSTRLEAVTTVGRIERRVDAHIATRLGTSAAARLHNHFELAPGSGLATIIGANAPVVADQISAADTVPKMAVVIHCTEVVVIARRDVQPIFAARRRVARVVGADIRIVTHRGVTGHADSTLALIVHSAGILVVAWVVIAGMLTPQHRVATINRAEVAVIARKLPRRFAIPILALVTNGAGIAIIAGHFIGGVLTPFPWQTEVIGTDISIIALRQPIKDAEPSRAVVANGAGIAIVTGAILGYVAAAYTRDTTIGGADVTIITGQRPLPGLALAK